MPTKLDLTSFKNNAKSFKKGSSLGAIRKVVAEVVEDEKPKASKDIFLFNGKKHNAWKVLNLPLGADKKEIAAGYAKKIQMDPKNKSLYVMAYKALQR